MVNTGFGAEHIPVSVRIELDLSLLIAAHVVRVDDLSEYVKGVHRDEHEDERIHIERPTIQTSIPSGFCERLFGA